MVYFRTIADTYGLRHNPGYPYSMERHSRPLNQQKNSLVLMLLVLYKTRRVEFGSQRTPMGCTSLTYKKIKNFSQKNGLPSNVVRSMYLDRSGAVWILTSEGISKFVDEKMLPFLDQKGLFKQGVLSMTQAEDGS